MKEHALYYQSLGFSIIPIKKGTKLPLLGSWKEFQEVAATKEQVEQWWTDNPDANIAVVTGKVSGIIALDLDAKHGRNSTEFNIPPTPSARSGNGGEHFFFKHPGGVVENKVGIFGEGVDVRGDGGYIILAPSVNSSGGVYEWITPLEDNFVDAPQWLLKNVQVGEKKWAISSDKVVEGTRNDTATSVAGKILNSLPDELKEFGWPSLLEWNKNIPKPLPEKELHLVWESVKKYPDDKNKTATQSDSLLAILEQQPGVTLFHDERDNPHIALQIGTHQEIWPCNGKNLKKWLSNEYYKKHGKGPNSEALKNALNIIEAKACFSGETYNLNNRNAWKENELWYDLTNQKWQAIRITKNGWNVIDNPPILFKRYPHQASQILPIAADGNVGLILGYVNITNKNHQLLLMVFMISCFIPDFPHALLLVYGSHGSAKSTLSRLMRAVIDPSLLDTASLPYGQREFAQLLDHHAFIFFDNVSAISAETSDILCRAVTGSGFSKRQLYTDDDDIIFSFKRCIGINGINIVATRPDLLERSLVIELARIDPSKRMEEGELMEKFEQDLPKILGGIFEVLSKALQVKPTIKLAASPRMADFAAWGCAIAQALGYSSDDFLSAYKENIDQQNDLVISESIVARVVVDFMQDKNEWKGSATELLHVLDALGFLDGIDSYEQYWPKSSGAFMRKLNELRVNLKEVGIVYTNVSNGMSREITLTNLNFKKSPEIKPLLDIENVADDLTI